MSTKISVIGNFFYRALDSVHCVYIGGGIVCYVCVCVCHGIVSTVFILVEE